MPDSDIDIASLDSVSRRNVHVQRMFDEGLPFDRATYMRLRYGGTPPTPWTIEEERGMPPVFRHPHADQLNAGLERFGEAIGVTYTGEFPG